MRRIAFLFGLPVVVASLSILTEGQTQAPKSSVVLTSLTGKTGWIPLGDITADGKRWAAGNDPSTSFITGVYEIPGSGWDRRTPRLPKVGARIRLTVDVPVQILDYRISGEKRRLDPPASANRPLGPQDETGIRLPAGSVLEVRAVAISKPHGDVRGVWARVVSASD
jgi:hypothetical protein